MAQIAEYVEWGNWLHGDSRPVDGQVPGTVDAVPHHADAESFVRYRHEARVRLGIGDTIVHRTVRVTTERGDWDSSVGCAKLPAAEVTS